MRLHVRLTKPKTLDEAIANVESIETAVRQSRGRRFVNAVAVQSHDEAKHTTATQCDMSANTRMTDLQQNHTNQQYFRGRGLFRDNINHGMQNDGFRRANIDLRSASNFRDGSILPFYRGSFPGRTPHHSQPFNDTPQRRRESGVQRGFHDSQQQNLQWSGNARSSGETGPFRRG